MDAHAELSESVITLCLAGAWVLGAGAIVGVGLVACRAVERVVDGLVSRSRARRARIRSCRTKPRAGQRQVRGADARGAGARAASSRVGVGS